MKKLKEVTNIDIDGLFSCYADKLESLKHHISDNNPLFTEELDCLYKIQKDIQKRRVNINAPILKFIRMVTSKAYKLNEKVLSIEKLALNKIEKHENKK